MKRETSNQQDMFKDMQDRGLYQRVHEYGFQYLQSALERRVYPTREAIERLAVLDEPMPESPTPALEVIDTLHQVGSPTTVSQIAGRYFGFVCGGAIPAGMAAKALATYWDQNAAMYVLSPIASKLESVVEGWLKELLGLPESTVAGFVSGTSLATYCGLAAARYRLLERLGWDLNEKGLFGAPPLRVVAGRHAHSTVLKAIALLGLGKGRIEWVEVDHQGRMLADSPPELDDRSILILQAGNVNSGSFDPFEQLCSKAQGAGAWVHIDGAFGLWAAATERLSHLTRGMEKANSWSVDGHKTLNTPYDSGIILCRDEHALVSALHMSGSYIITSEAKDGMFTTPEMSRRARAVELWATLKNLGKSGVDEMITGMHVRAVQFASELAAEGFEILNEVVLNQVLVTAGDDDLTEKTIQLIQESGECWVGGATWHGRSVIRISVSSWATTPQDITRSVRAFAAARDQVIQTQRRQAGS